MPEQRRLRVYSGLKHCASEREACCGGPCNHDRVDDCTKPRWDPCKAHLQSLLSNDQQAKYDENGGKEHIHGGRDEAREEIMEGAADREGQNQGHRARGKPGEGVVAVVVQVVAEQGIPGAPEPPERWGPKRAPNHVYDARPPRRRMPQPAVFILRVCRSYGHGRDSIQIWTEATLW